MSEHQLNRLREKEIRKQVEEKFSQRFIQSPQVAQSWVDQHIDAIQKSKVQGKKFYSISNPPLMLIGHDQNVDKKNMKYDVGEFGLLKKYKKMVDKCIKQKLFQHGIKASLVWKLEAIGQQGYGYAIDSVIFHSRLWAFFCGCGFVHTSI